MDVMAEERRCDEPSCGRMYVAKRPTSRFCSAKCRNRSARRGDAPGEEPGVLSGVLVVPGGPLEGEVQDAEEPPPPLVAATERQLLEWGVLESVAGQQALVLAWRMVSAIESGSAVATCSAHLTKAMAEAEKSQKRVDPLDEIRRRREEKLARLAVGE